MDAEIMDEVAFLNSELVQDAVIRNIEIIGEASKFEQVSASNFEQFQRGRERRCL